MDKYMFYALAVIITKIYFFLKRKKKLEYTFDPFITTIIIILFQYESNLRPLFAVLDHSPVKILTLLINLHHMPSLPTTTPAKFVIFFGILKKSKYHNKFMNAIESTL